MAPHRVGQEARTSLQRSVVDQGGAFVQDVLAFDDFEPLELLRSGEFDVESMDAALFNGVEWVDLLEFYNRNISVDLALATTPNGRLRLRYSICAGDVSCSFLQVSSEFAANCIQEAADALQEAGIEVPADVFSMVEMEEEEDETGSDQRRQLKKGRKKKRRGKKCKKKPKCSDAGPKNPSVDAAESDGDQLVKKAPGVGAWGGTCTCPGSGSRVSA